MASFWCTSNVVLECKGSVSLPTSSERAWRKLSAFRPRITKKTHIWSEIAFGHKVTYYLNVKFFQHNIWIYSSNEYFFNISFEVIVLNPLFLFYYYYYFGVWEREGWGSSWVCTTWILFMNMSRVSTNSIQVTCFASSGNVCARVSWNTQSNKS